MNIKDKSNTLQILGTSLGQLVAQKNEAYGDAVNNTEAIMKILYPNGIPFNQIGNSLLVTRIIDKLCRIATDNDTFGESPFKDIGGYGLLGWCKIEENASVPATESNTNPVIHSSL